MGNYSSHSDDDDSGGGANTIKNSPMANNKVTWIQFLQCLKEMNNKFFLLRNERDEYLYFVLNKKSSHGLFWRSHVNVKCFNVNSETRHIVSCKELSFKEFMNVYNVHKASVPTGTTDASTSMTTSKYIFKEAAGTDGQCCICMESVNEVLLPCLHAFCMVCITQELEIRPQFSCPICKMRIERPIEDSWEVPDHPDLNEVASYLNKLAMPRIFILTNLIVIAKPR